jgi:hypothetical protein
MRRAASTYRSWVIVACLAALCLSPAAAEPPGKGDLDPSGDRPETVLFNSVTTSASSVPLPDEKRTRQQGIDNLLAIIHQQAAVVFKSKYCQYLSDQCVDVTHRAERAATPIRSPPLRNS